MIRSSFLSLIGLLFFCPGYAQHATDYCKTKRAGKVIRESDVLDTRSDSIDILHYTIDLDLTRSTEDLLAGICTVKFTPRVAGIGRIVLDLRGYGIDSVKAGEQQLMYSREGEKLSIETGAMLNPGDTFSIAVYYRGTPAAINPGNFGGVYHNAPGFVYNIGVSFLDDPHNFGKVWFPCFDNFVERSTYTCIIHTDTAYTSYCGGLLTADETSGAVRSRTWEINQEIPSYLASFAVAKFEELNFTYESLLNPSLNVKLAALAGDTAFIKTAFARLENIFHLFEQEFGPYRWDRVGYVFVPFMAGAMEHAMNIAYPRDYVRLATLAANEGVMAHELAHHWFGNLATCRTASEMWLNEGFARYTEFLFDEWLNSRATYDNKVRVNHTRLVPYLHIRAGGYFPLSNVPTSHTYSEYTYDYPADIIHTLRSYMGDSAFFRGLKHYLDVNSFKEVTSDELLDALEASSGQDLHNFFDDWVHTPGWPHFSVDSFTVAGNQVTVYFRQKSAGNDHVYRNVPFTVTFIDTHGNRTEQPVSLSGPLDSETFTLSFTPEFVYLNSDDRISHAVTAEERVIKTTGPANWTNAQVIVDTKAIVDSALVRIEHNWVAPDPIKAASTVYTLSPNHYWTVKGITDSLVVSGTFTYDGRKPSLKNSGWIDTEFSGDEFKLVMLHRRDASADWIYVPSRRNRFTLTTDLYGTFKVDTLQNGEYAFAESDTVVLDYDVGIYEPEYTPGYLTVFPNPAVQSCRIHWTLTGDDRAAWVELSDLGGKVVMVRPVNDPDGGQADLNLEGLAAGYYTVQLRLKKGGILRQNLVVSW